MLHLPEVQQPLHVFYIIITLTLLSTWPGYMLACVLGVTGQFEAIIIIGGGLMALLCSRIQLAHGDAGSRWES